MWDNPKGLGVGQFEEILRFVRSGVKFLFSDLSFPKQIIYQISHQGSPRYWSGEPIPSSEDLPDPGVNPGSPALQVDSLPAELPGNFIHQALF